MLTFRISLCIYFYHKLHLVRYVDNWHESRPDFLVNYADALSWASCQIRKIAGAHAPGMLGTFSLSPRVSDPDMHYGTCVTHVPWCMLGSLTSGFLWNWRWGKTFPALPAHAQPAILRIWKEAHWGRKQVPSRSCGLHIHVIHMIKTVYAIYRRKHLCQMKSTKMNINHDYRDDAIMWYPHFYIRQWKCNSPISQWFFPKGEHPEQLKSAHTL